MRAVCLGEVLIDYISTDVGPLLDAHQFVRCLGGGAANLAVGLHTFGLEVNLCSRVGRDPMGTVALNELDQHGLSSAHVVIDAVKPTKCCFISHDQTGRRYIDVVNRNSADQNMDGADVLPVLEAPFSLLHISGVMLLSDQGLAIVQQCTDVASRHNALVSFDPVFDLQHAHESVKNRIFDVLPRCHVVKLNDSEFRAVSDRLANNNAVSPVIVHTRGDQGAVIKAGQHTVTVPAHPATCKDPTGAGDAFFAAFLADFLHASDGEWPPPVHNLEQMGQQGVRHAARIIAHVGGTTYYSSPK